MQGVKSRLPARKFLSGPMQYACLTLDKQSIDIFPIRLNLLVRCIGPSRNPHADRRGRRLKTGGTDRVGAGPDDVSKHPMAVGVVALKALAHFLRPEGSLPRGLKSKK